MSHSGDVPFYRHCRYSSPPIGPGHHELADCCLVANNVKKRKKGCNTLGESKILEISLLGMSHPPHSEILQIFVLATHQLVRQATLRDMITGTD